MKEDLSMKKSLGKLSFLVCLALLLSVFAGCAAATPTTAPTAASTPTSAVDDMSIKYEISWLGASSNATASDGTWIQKMLEEKFNVTIKPIFMDETNYVQKKQLLMAGGDIPDLIWNGDPLELQQQADQGFLLEMPYDQLKKLAPAWFEVITKYSPNEWLLSYVGGKNYGIPTNYTLGFTPAPGVWRMDWLKKVGITKVPSTLDEMHTAFLAFKAQDPNGNGSKPTYGMTADMKDWWLTFSEIFGAYGVAPYDWQDVNGTIIWGGIQPEAKQALAVLATWYKEGLIDPDFVTDSLYDQGLSKFTNGTTGYYGRMGDAGSFMNTAEDSITSVLKKLQPGAEIAVGNYPTGPDGKAGQHVWGSTGNIICFGKQLATEPGKLARLLKLLDSEVSDESLAVTARAGQQGVMWDFNDKTVGANSGIKALAPYDDQATADKNCATTNLVGNSFFAPVASDPDFVTKYTPKAVTDFRAQYQQSKFAIADAFSKPDVVASAGKYLEDLRTLQETAYAMIIRGDKDISYFDEFVTQWKAKGGDQITVEANDLGKTADSIYKLIGIK
jgi:putative aldouronate transport system substrate-binding protein